jgi:ERCC4-type nuclease
LRSGEKQSETLRLRPPYRQAKAKRKKSRQLRILQSLPGVGPDRAKRLLEHFGTVRACFGASTEEIMEVEGMFPVGKELNFSFMWMRQPLPARCGAVSR